MQPNRQFFHYDSEQTPMGLENVPDQMKFFAQKHSRNSNFDILFSKYLNNGELTDIQLQQLNSQEKIILEEVKKKNQTKTKRPDEYQKLFFKKAFKYAEHTFFKKNKKNRSRRMSQFYHYHFDSVAETLKISIFHFYHPDKKTKPGLTTGQKSFNSSYVKTVLKSASFRKVCIEYHEKFREECRLERNKKISTFTGCLFAMVEKSKQDRTKLIRFLQSSKCKIPWTNRDIEEAYKRAWEDLDDYSLEEENESKQQEGQINKIDDNTNDKEKENDHIIKEVDDHLRNDQLFFLNERQQPVHDDASEIQLLRFQEQQPFLFCKDVSNERMSWREMSILHDIPSYTQLQSSVSSQFLAGINLNEMKLQ